MARRLDHSKGGQYQPDPARVQQTNDFDQIDDIVVKGKRKPQSAIWGSAMIAIRRSGLSVKDLMFSQEELLISLGITKKDMRSRHRGAILKRLIGDGILLKNGKPNFDNPKVLDVVIQNRKVR